MTMREKIARAMEAAADNWLAGEAKDGMRWNGMADVPLEILADAALSAMREPTPGVLAAAWKEFRGERRGMLIGPGPGFKEAIQAMIDNAIQEKGE